MGVFISLRLPALTDAPVSSRPTVSLGGYSVAIRGEAKVLRRADFEQLRRDLLITAARARRAATLAHTKLAKLGVKGAGAAWTTSLVPSKNQIWSVSFHAPDDSFNITVDLERDAVIHVSRGAAATPVP